MYSLAHSELKYRRVDRDDETWIHLSGSLDAYAAQELRVTLDELAGTAWRLVIIDASALVFIDSSGVGLLVSLLKRIRASGGQVVMRGLIHQPLAVFRLLSLYPVFVPAASAAIPTILES